MSLVDCIPQAGFNVTVDPASPALPVDDPEITEVIDLVTGEIRDTRTLISALRYDGLVAERVRIKEGLKDDRPTHACALCATPVYLVASPRKRFFFRHIHEDGSCRARTRNSLTEEQIRARKYHGLRESEAHKQIKELIIRSLRADPSFLAHSIRSETRWSAEGDPKLWRQPDVQAQSIAGRYAFEAQLSTTFLDVVVSRRLFYRDEGALLVWVLRHFSPEYRRMTTDDLLFSNNSNVFVVDDDTVGLSEKSGRFHLRCHYRRSIREGDAIVERWDEAVVAFDALTQDVERQRVYYFDCEAEQRRLHEENDQNLRDEFAAFWRETMNPHFSGTSENAAMWADLRRRLAVRSVVVPEHPSAEAGFRSLMHGVFSAICGKPVGWHFDSLIQVAHQLAQAHPQNLLAFGYAVEHAGNKALLETQDTSGKWARKRREFRPRILARDPAYMPQAEWLPALTFLFPKVGGSVRGFVERNLAAERPASPDGEVQ